MRTPVKAVFACMAVAGLLLAGQPAAANSDAGSRDVAASVAAVIERAKPTVSAAEIEANNAAAWASLPPNVTMTVIGKMPKLQGPIDHYTQNGTTTTTGGVGTLAATLPYDYTFSHVWNLWGREFTSRSTTVCKIVEATWDYPVWPNQEFKITLSAGGTITVPTDGVARSWCWWGVPTNTTLQFHYYSTNNSGGNFAFASGSGRVGEG